MTVPGSISNNSRCSNKSKGVSDGINTETKQKKSEKGGNSGALITGGDEKKKIEGGKKYKEKQSKAKCQAKTENSNKFVKSKRKHGIECDTEAVESTCKSVVDSSQSHTKAQKSELAKVKCAGSVNPQASIAIDTKQHTKKNQKPSSKLKHHQTDRAKTVLKGLDNKTEKIEEPSLIDSSKVQEHTVGIITEGRTKHKEALCGSTSTTSLATKATGDGRNTVVERLKTKKGKEQSKQSESKDGEGIKKGVAEKSDQKHNTQQLKHQSKFAKSTRQSTRKTVLITSPTPCVDSLHPCRSPDICDSLGFKKYVKRKSASCDVSVGGSTAAKGEERSKTPDTLLNKCLTVKVAKLKLKRSDKNLVTVRNDDQKLTKSGCKEKSLFQNDRNSKSHNAGSKSSDNGVNSGDKSTTVETSRTNSKNIKASVKSCSDIGDCKSNVSESKSSCKSNNSKNGKSLSKKISKDSISVKTDKVKVASDEASALSAKSSTTQVTAVKSAKEKCEIKKLKDLDAIPDTNKTVVKDSTHENVSLNQKLIDLGTVDSKIKEKQKSCVNESLETRKQDTTLIVNVIKTDRSPKSRNRVIVPRSKMLSFKRLKSPGSDIEGPPRKKRILNSPDSSTAMKSPLSNVSKLSTVVKSSSNVSKSSTTFVNSTKDSMAKSGTSEDKRKDIADVTSLVKPEVLDHQSSKNLLGLKDTSVSLSKTSRSGNLSERHKKVSGYKSDREVFYKTHDSRNRRPYSHEKFWSDHSESESPRTARSSTYYSGRSSPSSTVRLSRPEVQKTGISGYKNHWSVGRSWSDSSPPPYKRPRSPSHRSSPLLRTWPRSAPDQSSPQTRPRSPPDRSPPQTRPRSPPERSPPQTRPKFPPDRSPPQTRPRSPPDRSPLQTRAKSPSVEASKTYSEQHKSISSQHTDHGKEESRLAPASGMGEEFEDLRVNVKNADSNREERTVNTRGKKRGRGRGVGRGRFRGYGSRGRASPRSLLQINPFEAGRHRGYDNRYGEDRGAFPCDTDDRLRNTSWSTRALPDSFDRFPSDRLDARFDYYDDIDERRRRNPVDFAYDDSRLVDHSVLSAVDVPQRNPLSNFMDRRVFEDSDIHRQLRPTINNVRGSQSSICFWDDTPHSVDVSQSIGLQQLEELPNPRRLIDIDNSYISPDPVIQALRNMHNRITHMNQASYYN